MPLQGSLGTMPLPEVLTWISQYQKTGTLEIEAGEAKQTLAFEHGILVFSSSSDPKNTLGRILIKAGIVTEEVHKQARELRKTKSVAIAKALLDLEALTEEDLIRFLRKKAEKEIFDLCERTEGSFTFTETDLPKLDLLPLRVDVSRTLLRVMQDRDEKGEYDFDATGIHLDIPKDI